MLQLRILRLREIKPPAVGATEPGILTLECQQLQPTATLPSAAEARVRLSPACVLTDSTPLPTVWRQLWAGDVTLWACVCKPWPLSLTWSKKYTGAWRMVFEVSLGYKRDPVSENKQNQ